MKTIKTKEKNLTACILSLVDESELGLVKVTKTTKGYEVELEIKFPKEVENRVQDAIKEFETDSLKIDAKLLMKKYRFVDNIVRVKIERLKR